MNTTAPNLSLHINYIYSIILSWKITEKSLLATRGVEQSADMLCIH